MHSLFTQFLMLYRIVSELFIAQKFSMIKNLTLTCHQFIWSHAVSAPHSAADVQCAGHLAQ